MPIYLDRHDLPGVSAEDVARAHLADLEAQAEHQVHYHTYWFDPASATVFCLAEGPSREAVEAVHRDAHGIMASTVLELDSTEPLNRFFGATPAFAPGVAYEAPALRVIVFTDIRGSVAMTHEHGDEGHMHLLGEHDRLVRAELAANAGREVKHTGDGIMASFDSAVAAVAFAVTVQRRLEERNAAAAVPIHVGIGISAGEPVTNDVGDLFGAAVQLAARLCALAEPGEVTVSSAVRELCVGKKIDFVDRGAATIKGVPEPVVSFAVHWCA